MLFADNVQNHLSIDGAIERSQAAHHPLSAAQRGQRQGTPSGTHSQFQLNLLLFLSLLSLQILGTHKALYKFYV